MGYYMRFIVADEQPVSLGMLEGALKELDAAYAVTDVADSGDYGLLAYGGEHYGVIEVNHPGDGIFEGELAELREFVKAGDGPGDRRRVLEALDAATAVVAAQVVWGGRETEDTLVRIAPLWEWLFTHRNGLLQADGEGYYKGPELILKVD